MPELVVKPVDRYISVEGSHIDALGEQHEPIISPSFILNRRRRDNKSTGHHITLINHLEIGHLIESNEPELSLAQRKKLLRKYLHKVYRDIVDTFGSGYDWERPVDLGLGICRQGDAVSYYRVIYWPFGQVIRQHVGLPPTCFHITVGFAPHDVHLYKGPGSLLCLDKKENCTLDTAHFLLSMVPSYFQDRQFIQRLYQVFWENGYYAETIQLTQTCTKCKLYV